VKNRITCRETLLATVPIGLALETWLASVVEEGLVSGAGLVGASERPGTSLGQNELVMAR
jgi:hypothetical protein